MSTKSNVTPQIAFVDLATFSELEAYLYGGAMAVTYFVRSVKKANWFSFVHTSLRLVSGTPDFNQEFSASINRSGDYVLNSWLRVRVPKLKLTLPTSFTVDPGVTFRWTHEFMHNLVKKCNITFNELQVQEFDSRWLDYNHFFTTPASKRVGYNTMIGEIDAMVGPKNAFLGELLGTGGFFNLPLPFWHAVDSGVALPVAALPFNDIKYNFSLRDWRDMIVIDPGTSGLSRDALLALITTEAGGDVKLSQVEVFAHYAVVHNDDDHRQIFPHHGVEFGDVEANSTVSGQT